MWPLVPVLINATRGPFLKREAMPANQPGSYYLQGLLIEGTFWGALGRKKKGKTGSWSLYLSLLKHEFCSSTPYSSFRSPFPYPNKTRQKPNPQERWKGPLSRAQKTRRCRSPTPTPRPQNNKRKLLLPLRPTTEENGGEIPKSPEA